MKTAWKTIRSVSIWIATAVLFGCAQNASLEVAKLEYQAKSNSTLSKYAQAVSRGFVSLQRKTGHGVIYGTGATTDTASPYGGYILRQALSQEIRD